ncbi:ABC-F family ATP-binding cassette domain-containing protein [uncultured Roseibium sp.]|uniref:ABC-F family ATP-binding cassette domain-containing protein n=1 Tax=uncultured Roseibium sp. TaxID=1936171 RepID=UPI00262395B3|nr:ABC-F family ATP-binding cassette domain-containing protein [uncultured Roseibium sp.]
MSLINLRNLSVVLSENLFENLNLTLGKTDRIGLVAANGTGKSTLLRVLAGEAEPTNGDITMARGLKTGLVSQDVPDHLTPLTLYEAVLSGLDREQAESESWRVDVVLHELQVPEALWQRRLCDLSGGWQRVALLSRVWVGEPDVLLMDEPTNHLDLSRIGIFQHWLTSVARGTPMIVASHDRAFLDTVSTRTLFLRREQPVVFDLPYSKARQSLEELDRAAERRFENDLAKANQLRRKAAKLKNIGTNSGSDLLLSKTKQLTQRAQKIENAARPVEAQRPAGKIKLETSTAHAKALVTLAESGVDIPNGRTLFRLPRLWINPGDRVVVLGANGAGKSRLLSKVITALDEDMTNIRVAPSAVPGVSDQSLSQLDRFRTPMLAVTQSSSVGDHRARALLAEAGLHIDLQNRPVSILSGGQRSRLAMLLLRLLKPNLYILDEPTNHLDIGGQEALERELLREETTALLVSHDRTFVRNVGSRFWLIEDKKLREVETPEAFFEKQIG